MALFHALETTHLMSFIRRIAVLLGAAVIIGAVVERHPAQAQSVVTTPRRVVNVDSGWRYLEDAATDVHATERVPLAQWQRVDLPHTWNALDAVDPVPGYRRDASWYQRALTVPNAPADARFVLHFEGANTVADVYVNGRRAGGHVGGYVGFDVDVTPFVKRGAPNDLRVRVDNHDDPTLIPSDKSDFVIYGGLTRDVWLQVLPATSIAHVSVRTPSVSRASAQVRARIALGGARRSGRYTADVQLRDPNGVVASSIIAPVSDSTRWIDLPAVASPKLWSPASPVLYTLSVTLRRDGTALDETSERIGLRWYEFQPNGPFLLNGERLLLRGTHRHEEGAGQGAALSNAQHRADMAAIKAIGANFVRLAHYPQDPEVYRAADSLGILLWDELPWCRGGMGDSAWQSNTRRLLREQITQNENHPSIILWSMGNEVADLLDDPATQTPPRLAAFMRELTNIAHEMDSGRLTSTRKFDEGFESVDVYSPSIWAGWYRGVYRDYEKALADARAKYPRLLHMEYGADAHAGRHTEHPISGEGMRIDSGTTESVGKIVRNIAINGDWSESYQTDLLDWHLMVSERTPWLTGTAQWIFRDFATPLRPENPIPYVNQKGLVDRSGQPKDAYYVFKSYWTTAPQFVYIVSHSWTERTGAAGSAREVRTYSNCPTVELWLNGASQGVRTRRADDFPAQGLRWQVPFVDGKNTLRARCGGASASDSLTVRYTTKAAAKPDHIALTTHPLPNGRLLLEATVVDAGGRRALDYSGRVFFGYSGGGRLVADQGTPTGSRVIEAANGRAAIEVVPPSRGEHAEIVVRTQELNGSRLSLRGP